MTQYEAMVNRHSVRTYLKKEIEQELLVELQSEINKCNTLADLNIQLITNDDAVFKGLMAHYGGFRNVSNYIAFVGKTSDTLAETVGYYGEHLVLKAQQLGLNTCWVAATYKKGKCKAVVNENCSLVCIIALGYGQTQGVPHKSKSMDELCRVKGEMPDWFEKGMHAVMLAPTALNKQNVTVVLNDNDVTYNVKESKYGKIDLGIVKYHFQIGSGEIEGI